MRAPLEIAFIGLIASCLVAFRAGGDQVILGRVGDEPAVLVTTPVASPGFAYFTPKPPSKALAIREEPKMLQTFVSNEIAGFVFGKNVFAAVRRRGLCRCLVQGRGYRSSVCI